MTNICSAQCNNLFFTYLLSKSTNAKGTIILLDGLPSNPLSKNKLMQKLSKSNYDIFFPRYEGTWESKGIFLERNPSEAIIEFIKKLKEGQELENKKYFAKKIFILGASFGGGVALDIANKYNIDKIFVVSPVTSFKTIDGIETLENYLKKEQSKNYRFNSKRWRELMIDKILDLNFNEIKEPFNIYIATGKNDDEVKEKEVIEFGRRNHIKVKVYDSGHITLSKISDQILNNVLDFFNN